MLFLAAVPHVEDVMVGTRTIRVTITRCPGGAMATAHDPDLTYAGDPPRIALDAYGRAVAIMDRVPPDYLSAIAQVIDLLTLTPEDVRG